MNHKHTLTMHRLIGGLLVAGSLATLTTACDTAEGSEATASPEVAAPERSINLDKITLPEGFSISLYAKVDNARSMALSPSGVLYVGNRSEDKVYAVKDEDGDFQADKVYEIDRDLNMPNGVAIRNGNLYVAEVNRILRYDNIEAHLDNPPEPVVVYDQLPTERHHGWKYIAFGPDGKLYVPVGAPCNICKSEEEIYASIARMNPDGSGLEVYAHGVRNTVGFTWHPQTGDMYFTDNGRDMMGDNYPPCELNRATQKGQHFGYPFCHGGEYADPEFGGQRNCSEFVKPFQNLGPHVAPLGVKFKSGSMFPAKYDNVMFIAEHGSWNRSRKIGYRISMVGLDANGRTTGYSTFAEGWLNTTTQNAWGRPVDVLFMPDGSMLISDDQAGAIYRVTYQG